MGSPRPVWARALRHVGRRGAFLLFLLELDLIVGYSLLVPLPFGLSAAQVYRPFVMVMPLTAWAAWWIGAGALCGVAAGWWRVRPAAFGLASLLKCGWGAVYLVGWMDGQLTRGWLSTAIFWTFAAIVLVVSSWREHLP